MKKIMISAAALAMLAGSTSLIAGTESRLYRQAMNLYSNGMYDRARTLFLESAQKHDDPLSEGYAILCAIRMGLPDCQYMVDGYETRYPASAVTSLIHWYQGLVYFDAQEYESASAEFGKVNKKVLSKKDAVQTDYKTAYCAFEAGAFSMASEGFRGVIDSGVAEYKAPASYSLGYIEYSRGRFAEAEQYFKEAARDPRFEQVADYYALECRFMQKDYNYTAAHGEAIFKASPQERQSRLARIISESFLVLGNSEKSMEYFKLAQDKETDKSRNDWFYSGSVYFASGDYKAAIDDYSMMTARTDSLGQIANYNLGYSYIKTKNKVSALGAFKDASRFAYDPAIQEDAHFNYAKLAFDLNKDASVFKEYLGKYNSKQKSDQIYSYIALANLYEHDYAGAVDAYDNIDELTPDMRGNYMKANYLRANQLVTSGAYSTAIPCLKASTFFTSKQDPMNQLARYWLAECQYRVDNHQEAQKIYTELYNASALDGWEEGRNISYNLAYSYFNSEDYKNAARWFDQYLSDPKASFTKDALERRGDCEFAEKNYKKAAEFYQKSVDADKTKDNLYPYYQLGICYGLDGKQSKKAEVLALVKDAPATAQYYGDLMYELGRSYVELKKENDAVQVFTRLASQAPGDNDKAKACIELGMISRNRKKYDEALEYYKRVVALKPEGSIYDDAIYAIEAIYQSKGDAEGYLSYIENLGSPVVRTDAEKENIYWGSAEQNFVNENYQKAISSLQKYISDYPKGAHVKDANFYLAESFRMTGSKEKACDYYKAFIGLPGESSFSEAAMLNYAMISYGLENFQDAFEAYSQLAKSAKMDVNVHVAEVGMMRSAFKAKSFAQALASANVVKESKASTADETWEADYVIAKSYLGTSQRDMAFAVLEKLAAKPSTAEGAEASYIIIQDIYDKGQFDKVEDKVYSFSEKAGDQSYWLAKAFIVLGDSFAERENFAQAKATFESIRDGYQSQSQTDDILDTVKSRLEKLPNNN